MKKCFFISCRSILNRRTKKRDYFRKCNSITTFFRLYFSEKLMICAVVINAHFNGPKLQNTEHNSQQTNKQTQWKYCTKCQ